MADSEPREEIIFESALKLPANERAAYLDQACAGEAMLRARVDRLLAALARSGDFLQPPVGRPAPGRAVDMPGDGDRIGHYKLLQQIGEGGCGVVYMAEQEEPIRRRVALKVIKLGMDTKQVIARFEAERQALALMDHPNIAKVLDAGATQTSRPFFVMELVRGVKITEFCDRNKLSTEARLKLFIQVCQAVQHAHQKGIIHRDLKPSNILVTVNDDVPVPKVIDFGIAKATQGRLTDQTLFTAFEQFIGTPAYMSPEQAVMTSLDIDTRSDIYSLGVLLYELLTGKTPFDQQELLAAGLDEMRRTIREKEPPKPSTRLSTMAADALTTTAHQRQTAPPKLVHAIRGDLDWIVMKCLEKDRVRRYETANGLAADLQRHLSNEPVVARPPSKLYEFQKTVRRHKFGFAATAAVILALAIGLAVSIRLYWEAQAEREKAQAEKKKAQIEATKSEQVARFLKDMLKSVEPSVALGRDSAMLREILDKTAERVGKELANQPEVEAELRSTIGKTYFELGSYSNAAAMHREALRLRKSLFGDTNELVAQSLTELGNDMLEAGEPAEAEAMMRKALALREMFYGREHPEVANSLRDLADVIFSSQVAGKLEEAEIKLQTAVAQQRRLLSAEHPDLAASLQMLGSVLRARDKLPEAEAVEREALEMWRKLRGVESPDVATALLRLGSTLRKQGKLTEAESLQRKGLALRRSFLGENHAWVVSAVQILALTLRSQGRLDEVVALYQEAVNRGSVSAMNGLAWALATTTAAEFRNGSNAVAWAEKAVAGRGGSNAMYLDTLAAAYAELGQFGAAVNIQKKAVALARAEDEKTDYALRLRLYESDNPYRNDGDLASEHATCWRQERLSKLKHLPANVWLCARSKCLTTGGCSAV